MEVVRGWGDEREGRGGEGQAGCYELLPRVRFRYIEGEWTF